MITMKHVASRKVTVAFAWTVLAGIGTVSAAPISLSEFAIFAGGGVTIDGNDELQIAGHNLIKGHIGSNQDIGITGATQILGSIYAGRNLQVGSNSVIGSDGVTPGPNLASSTRFVSPAVYPLLLAEVVANQDASFSGGLRLYGNLFADKVSLGTNADVLKAGGIGGNVSFSNSFSFNSGADVEGTLTGPAPTTTFTPLTLTSGISFTATGANQQVGGSGFLSLAPGSSGAYGALSTSSQFQTIRLTSGDYYFSSINAQGDFTLEIDLTSGAPININVVGNAKFGQDAVLKVKGAGTGGNFVPIGEAEQLASLIHWTLGGQFDLGGGDAGAWTTIFGGNVYSALAGGVGIIIDQRVDWYGSLHAFDTISLADHSRFNFVPEPPEQITGIMPEPATVTLGLLAAAGLMMRRRRAV